MNSLKNAAYNSAASVIGKNNSKKKSGRPLSGKDKVVKKGGGGGGGAVESTILFKESVNFLKIMSFMQIVKLQKVKNICA